MRKFDVTKNPPCGGNHRIETVHKFIIPTMTDGLREMQFKDQKADKEPFKGVRKEK